MSSTMTGALLPTVKLMALERFMNESGRPAAAALSHTPKINRVMYPLLASARQFSTDEPATAVFHNSSYQEWTYPNSGSFFGSSGGSYITRCTSTLGVMVLVLAAWVKIPAPVLTVLSTTLNAPAEGA